MGIILRPFRFLCLFVDYVQYEKFLVTTVAVPHGDQRKTILGVATLSVFYKF